MTCGLLLLTRLEVDTPYWQIAIYAIMVGAGLGLSMQTIIIAVQNAVDFKDMGIATSSNTFFRSLGAVFGTALFGSILTNRVQHYLQSNFAELVKSDPAAVNGFDIGKLESISSNTAILQTLSPVLQNTALDAFVSSFHIVFYAAAPITALGILLALGLRELPLRSNQEYATAREEATGDSLI